MDRVGYERWNFLAQRAGEGELIFSSDINCLDMPQSGMERSPFSSGNYSYMTCKTFKECRRDGWVFQGRLGSTDWSRITIKCSHVDIKKMVRSEHLLAILTKGFPCFLLSCKKLPACNTQTTGHSPLSPRTWRLHLGCLTFTASLTLKLNTPGLNPKKPSGQSYVPLPIKAFCTLSNGP